MVRQIFSTLAFESYHLSAVYLISNTVWTNFAATDALTCSPTFEAMLAGVAVSPLSQYSIELTGDLSSDGIIEVAKLSFPPESFAKDQRLFDQQLENCKGLGPRIVHGWTRTSAQKAPKAQEVSRAPRHLEEDVAISPVKDWTEVRGWNASEMMRSEMRDCWTRTPRYETIDFGKDADTGAVIDQTPVRDHNLPEIMVDCCDQVASDCVHEWRRNQHFEVFNECVVFLNWKSLDQMYDVKQDKDSRYNNRFVPLINEAGRGSKSALYTALREPQLSQGSCNVM